MSHRRLLWQLFPAYLLVTVIALLIVAGYLSRLLPEFYYNQVAGDLQARARLVEQQILPGLRQLDFKQINEQSKNGWIA